jgi:hypothetical protein
MGGRRFTITSGAKVAYQGRGLFGAGEVAAAAVEGDDVAEWGDGASEVGADLASGGEEEIHGKASFSVCGRRHANGFPALEC